MARLSIDDSVGRDPRITELALRLGRNRHETVGLLVVDVWPICYDQCTHLIAERLIDVAVGVPGFAKHMIECELASRDRSGKVRIRGAHDRVLYLNHKRIAGRAGGIKSGESRRIDPKQNARSNEARGNPNPNTNTPDPAPPPDPANPKKKERGSARARKPLSLSVEEQSSVRVVLEKLGAQNGIAYTGSGEHERLIAARLREGVSEMDLRKVVQYCAQCLEWRSDEKMVAYLRPETLFGPKTIAKYLDAARSWYAESEKKAAAK